MHPPQCANIEDLQCKSNKMFLLQMYLCQASLSEQSLRTTWSVHCKAQCLANAWSTYNHKEVSSRATESYWFYQNL